MSKNNKYLFYGINLFTQTHTGALYRKINFLVIYETSNKWIIYFFILNIITKTERERKEKITKRKIKIQHRT